MGRREGNETDGVEDEEGKGRNMYKGAEEDQRSGSKVVMTSRKCEQT